MSDNMDQNEPNLEQWVDEKMDTLDQGGDWRPNPERALGRFRKRTMSKPSGKGFALAAIVGAGACVVILALPWQVLWDRVSQNRSEAVGPETELASVAETAAPFQESGANQETLDFEEWEPVESQERPILVYIGNRGESATETGVGQGVGEGAGHAVGQGLGEGAGQGEGSGLDGEVFRIGGGVSAPSVISQVQPEYSEEARKARYQGVVVLEAVVHADGSVEIVRVVRSLGFGLDEKAIEALQQWKFRPGMRGRQAVPVALNIEVNFNLRHD